MATLVAPKVDPLVGAEKRTALMDRARALKIYTLATKKRLSLDKIGRALTPPLTRERVRQIMLANGWRTIRAKRGSEYPKQATSVCRRCKKEFTFNQQHRNHRKVYCSNSCIAFLQALGEVCILCHKPGSEKNWLTKMGKHRNGAQRWIHTKCSKKKLAKYGQYRGDRDTYNRKHSEWREKNKKYLVKYRWWQYHSKKCRCHDRGVTLKKPKVI